MKKSRLSSFVIIFCLLWLLGIQDGTPVPGMNTTCDLSSVIPDSAFTATAIACGYKTKSGVIGMDPQGKISYQNSAEVARKQGL